MTSLVIADHDNSSLKDSTLNAVTAAAKLGDVDILIAGSDCSAAADAAAKIAGVSKVLVADSADYAHPLAEVIAPLVVKLSEGYDAILVAATTTGKNFMPRSKALTPSNARFMPATPLPLYSQAMPKN